MNTILRTTSESQQLAANPDDLSLLDKVRRCRRQRRSQMIPSYRWTSIEHAPPPCPRLHGLHSTAFPRAVQYFQLRHDDFLDECVRLGSQHIAMRILLENFNARPVHQEGIVQNKKIIIKYAECVTLQAIIILSHRRYIKIILLIKYHVFFNFFLFMLTVCILCRSFNVNR